MPEELALNDRKPWTVEPVIGRDPALGGKRRKLTDPQVIIRHELRFNGKRVEKGVMPSEVRRLHSMAETFNGLGATPVQLTKHGDIQTDFFEGLDERSSPSSSKPIDGLPEKASDDEQAGDDSADVVGVVEEV